jgi:hypothetical protein
MTTGRINQVAAMRAPAPIVGHRRAIDEITKHDRLAWSHTDRQPTKGATIRASATRISASETSERTHEFSVRLPSTRCGVGMCKTVE